MNMNAKKNILSVKNLYFGYGPNPVLENVGFDVVEGDYIGLAGPNGAGKTTLIKTILGLVGNFKGTVELFGRDVNKFNDWWRVGYLPQRVNAFNPLFPATVEEVIKLGLLSKKSFPKRITKDDEVKVRETLELMGITSIAKKLIGDLSGGQQQRVFLARALVSKPELLIMDEPSTALDPQSRDNFFELVKKLNKDLGITIILITHDTAQIGEFSNKLLYLDKKVIFFGGFDDFCKSQQMNKYFDHFSQHLICHQHH